ncbi:hypothetical protein DIPPA_08584 [Diplonema papillatum]|nr:hypothetical protein DIPPA_08584 [Diplonema papillatum]
MSTSASSAKPAAKSAQPASKGSTSHASGSKPNLPERVARKSDNVVEKLERKGDQLKHRKHAVATKMSQHGANRLWPSALSSTDFFMAHSAHPTRHHKKKPDPTAAQNP